MQEHAKVFGTMTDGADARARKSTGPAILDTLHFTCQKPFKRSWPVLALLITIISRSTRPWRRGQPFRTGQGETVKLADIFDNGVNSGSLQHFEAGTKLFEKVSITPMQIRKKEHHKNNWGKHYLAMQHIHNQTVEPKAKLHNRLILALAVIKEGHKDRKSVCNSIGTSVLIKHCKHLKTLAMIQCSLVVE